jgi:class 3 adenylate cyclase/tetratricopeptide (TPR) repeat protein
MTIVSPLLDELASYVPALVINQLASNSSATMIPSARSFAAAVLFADISGFTALTEYLAQRNPAEAEDLTRWLNKYFETLVNIVTSHGGDVMKFAGDGLLALWYADDEDLPTLTYRALQCGLAVQMAMAPGAWSIFGATREPPVPLKVRVGIGAGSVTLMHLGGVRGRWELLVSGAPLAETGAAESEAQPGDVVMTPQAWELVQERCLGARLPAGNVRLEALLELLPMRPLPPPPLGPEIEGALNAYIPQAIRSRMAAGQTAWLAEQRRVTVLFINLPDLSEGTPLEQAQAAMRALQTALYSFRGSISRLGTDAKGPTVVAAMGLPPVSLEDDAERGVRAALTVIEALARLGLRCYIGVTTGQAFCGSVGSQTRREYTMMGPIVNLSARLMQAVRTLDQAGAISGPTVFCDEATVHTIRADLAFAPLTPIKVKGLAEPVAIFQPQLESSLPRVGSPPPSRVSRSAGELVGREREQGLIAQQLAALANQRCSGALVIEGDAGIGKSRLIDELRRQAAELGLPSYSGAGSSIDQLSAYHAWRPIFAGLLGLDSSQPQSLSELEQALRPLGLAPEIERFAPLLSAVLPISGSETSLISQLSPQVRARNTRELLLQIVQRVASVTPLLIVLEDAHWLDSASWTLALALNQLAAPVLLAVALRPLASTLAEYQQLLYSPNTRHIRLDGLSAEAVRALICQVFAVDSMPEPVWRFIAARSQGNPFFAEELAYTLRDSGQLVVAGGAARMAQELGSEPLFSTAQSLRAMRLPDTVQGLITSRIDQLEPAHQLTLKVASVIGSVFPFETLQAIYPMEGDRAGLRDHLFQIQQLGMLVIVAFEPELVYGFKQNLACEAAYNLMSYAQRRQLHRTLAELYERTYGSLELAVRSHALNAAAARNGRSPEQHPETHLAPHYALLAYHWRRADEPERAINYLERAGEQAIVGGAYQEAIDFFSEALALGGEPGAAADTSALRRASWLRQLGEAHYGLGHLVESRELLEQALDLLGMPVPSSPARQAIELLRELARQVGHRLLPFALVARARASSPTLAEAARAYSLLSRLAYYDSQLIATLHTALRGLNLAERVGYSPALTQSYATMQIATAALPPVAKIYQSRARISARKLGHLPTLALAAQSEGIMYAGLGQWARAKAALEQGLSIASKLGDHRRWAENRALQAWVLAFEGDLKTSQAMCREVYAEGAHHGDAQVRTWGLIGQAEVLLAQGAGARAGELLAEAERLLAENLASARAEEIWTYGLIALSGLQASDLPLARYAVSSASKLMREVPPVALYALLGYAGVAQVYLTLWEQRAYRSYAEKRALQQAAHEACTTMRRFAQIFPIGRPRTLQLLGHYAWLEGRSAQALAYWEQALRAAERLAMPLEQARAHRELGRHSVGAARHAHLAAAAALFEKLIG